LGEGWRAKLEGQKKYKKQPCLYKSLGKGDGECVYLNIPLRRKESLRRRTVMKSLCSREGKKKVTDLDAWEIDSPNRKRRFIDYFLGCENV